jgi:hypothetical protein
MAGGVRVQVISSAVVGGKLGKEIGDVNGGPDREGQVMLPARRSSRTSTRAAASTMNGSREVLAPQPRRLAGVATVDVVEPLA